MYMCVCVCNVTNVNNISYFQWVYMSYGWDCNSYKPPGINGNKLVIKERSVLKIW